MVLNIDTICKPAKVTYSAVCLFGYFPKMFSFLIQHKYLYNFSSLRIKNVTSDIFKGIRMNGRGL